MILVVYGIMVQLDFQNFACSLLYYFGYNILGTHGLMVPIWIIIMEVIYFNEMGSWSCFWFQRLTLFIL